MRRMTRDRREEANAQPAFVPALAGLPSSLKLRRDRTARQALNLPAMLRTAMQAGVQRRSVLDCGRDQ